MQGPRIRKGVNDVQKQYFAHQRGGNKDAKMGVPLLPVGGQETYEHRWNEFHVNWRGYYIPPMPMNTTGP
jgi:hypothetical protein